MLSRFFSFGEWLLLIVCACIFPLSFSWGCFLNIFTEQSSAKEKNIFIFPSFFSHFQKKKKKMDCFRFLDIDSNGIFISKSWKCFHSMEKKMYEKKKWKQRNSIISNCFSFFFLLLFVPSKTSRSVIILLFLFISFLFFYYIFKYIFWYAKKKRTREREWTKENVFPCSLGLFFPLLNEMENEVKILSMDFCICFFLSKKKKNGPNEK